MQTLGEKIKARRIKLGMSVQQLANLINVDRVTVYRYEKGEVDNVSINVLKPLAKALKTSIRYLLDDDSEYATPVGLDEVLENNAVMFDGEELTEEEKQQVKQMIKIITKKSIEKAIRDGDI